MLHPIGELKNFRLGATDGEFGRVKDFLFDDENWTIRYLVADTGSWLTRHEVLISPIAITGVHRGESRIDLNLDKERIENSPEIDSARPISRQQERSYYGYYGWPVYWGGTGLWGIHPYPTAVTPEAARAAAVAEEQRRQEGTESHLRSAQEVKGYHIEADDGGIGHVDDFLAEDETWRIGFLVVDTKNWWPGKNVVVPVQSIRRVSWPDRSVYIGLTREQIRQAPEYTPQRPVSSQYYDEVASYYGVHFSMR